MVFIVQKIKEKQFKKNINKYHPHSAAAVHIFIYIKNHQYSCIVFEENLLFSYSTR